MIRYITNANENQVLEGMGSDKSNKVDKNGRGLIYIYWQHETDKLIGFYYAENAPLFLLLYINMDIKKYFNYFMTLDLMELSCASNPALI